MEKNKKLTWDIIAAIIALPIGTVLMFIGQISCNYDMSDLGVIIMVLSFVPMLIVSIKESNQNK